MTLDFVTYVNGRIDGSERLIGGTERDSKGRDIRVGSGCH